MARVLSVDDSSADRQLIAGLVRELGHEVVEAADGVEGVEKAAAGGFALILIDLAMPGLDGAGLLEALRVQGDRTPVIMLMPEMKRPVVAALMKLGISGMLPKPLNPAEASAQIAKVLPPPAPPEAPPAPAEPAPAAARAADETAAPGAEVLIVNHMEEARQLLRAQVPEGVGVHSCASEQEATLLLRRHPYKIVYFDVELPVAGLPALIAQYRALQPEATMVGVLGSRRAASEGVAADYLAFDDTVARPFDPELVADQVDQYAQDYRRIVTVVEDNLLTVAAFRGRRALLDRYLDRLKTRLGAVFHQLVEGAFDRAIVDLRKLPPGHAPRAARFLAELLQSQAAMGLELRLVAAPAIAEALAVLPETQGFRCFASVGEALA